MPPSLLRTTSAVLCHLIGIDVKAMTTLLGCSVSTIQSLESGTRGLSLSKTTATKMALETGINESWLLAGDEKSVPLH